MRVLFVSGLTGFASGGVQTEMTHLVGGSRDRGIDAAFLIDRLPVRLTDIRHFPFDYPMSSNAGGQVRSAMDAFKPDCVHVIGGGVSLLRLMDGLSLNVPWYFTSHNVPPFERISGRFSAHDRLYYLVRNVQAMPAVLAWKRFLVRGGFSRVIAHSKAVAENLIRYRCPAEKVVAIPFGFQSDTAVPDVTKSPFAGDAYPKVLTVAGYAHHKGLHDYITAVGQLVTRFPKLDYRIIGNSRNKNYTQFLHDRIEKLNLKGNVSLVRNAGNDVKRAALSVADLYVQPSHEEGFCLAFGEAAMVAPRLLGCRTGEIAGLAEGDGTSRVVSPKDIDAMVSATKELMALEVSRADLEARVHRLQSKYSWSLYLDRHVDLFSRTQGEPDLGVGLMAST